MDEVAKDFQILLALHYFRTGVLTSGQAAEMAGENRVDFILRAGAEGIPVADLDAAELADEAAHAAPD